MKSACVDLLAAPGRSATTFCGRYSGCDAENDEAAEAEVAVDVVRADRCRIVRVVVVDVRLALRATCGSRPRAPAARAPAWPPSCARAAASDGSLLLRLAIDLQQVLARSRAARAQAKAASRRWRSGERRLIVVSIGCAARASSLRNGQYRCIVGSTVARPRLDAACEVVHAREAAAREPRRRVLRCGRRDGTRARARGRAAARRRRAGSSPSGIELRALDAAALELPRLAHVDDERRGARRVRAPGGELGGASCANQNSNRAGVGGVDSGATTVSNRSVVTREPGRRPARRGAPSSPALRRRSRTRGRRASAARGSARAAAAWSRSARSRRRSRRPSRARRRRPRAATLREPVRARAWRARLAASARIDLDARDVARRRLASSAVK